jgi:hypothetical protein
MTENLTGKGRGNLWAVGQTALKCRTNGHNNNAGQSLHCDYFFKMFIKSCLISLTFKLGIRSRGFVNKNEFPKHSLEL